MESSKESREYEEDTGEVEKSGSESSSWAAVPATGKYEKGGGDDGQDLRDDLEGVPPTTSTFPVDTLLEEVGLKLFGMLSDQDVASCFRAYPRWNQWLWHQRTQFLFPEVIPFLIQYLPEAALLNCRKVCRSWKIGLDNSYQTHSYHLQLESENWMSNDHDQFPQLINFLDSANKITSFLQDMESCPGNPFPGRNLILEWVDGPPVVERFMNYWNNSVIQLLDVFGHQVHFVYINFHVLSWFEHVGLHISNLVIGEILIRCLRRMPNLKKLEIQGDVGYVSDQLIRRTLLPQLASLETVTIEGAHHGTIVSILESCCDPHKIKRVKLLSMGGTFVSSVYGFQNLEVLNTDIRMGELIQFQSMEFRPPLRKVKLNFSCPHLGCLWRLIDFKLVFTMLEIFEDTLTDVQLGTGFPSKYFTLKDNDYRNGFRINLPKLERLSLGSYDGPLDPFIQLISLRYLNVRFKRARPWEGSTVRLYDFEERMECSNIWTLIPSLQTLAIKGFKGLGFFDETYVRIRSSNNQTKILQKYE